VCIYSEYYLPRTSVNGIEHRAGSDNVGTKFDLSNPNWRRIGFPEYQLVQDMIHVANLMSKWEDKAVAGEEVPIE
jgi:hypothetical protein